MGENKQPFIYLCILLAAFWCYCVVVSVIKPPFLAYYTFDETFITDSGVFLWFGITPRILDWPASPSVLMYGVIFAISVIYQVFTHISGLTGFLDVFSILDKTAYEYLFDREPYILAGRAVQLLVVLGGLLWTLRFLFLQKHPLLIGHGRLWVGLVVVTSHLIWNNAAVLRPEAISAVFFIHILCRLLFSERLTRQETLVLSALFAVVVAERLIFLFMAPLFWAGIFLLSGAGKWREMRFSLGVFVVSFLAFCPFAVTDPLIISKAFFGGILAKVNDNPMESLFNWDFISTYFDNPAAYPAIGLTILGVYRVWQEKKLIYRIMIGNWIFFLLLVLRSAKIYDPHVLPGALIHIVIIGLGLSTLAGLTGARRRFIAWGVGLLIVVGEVGAIVSYHTWVRRDRNDHEALKWIRQEVPAGSKILVNIDLGLHLPPDNRTLDRWIEATDNTESQLNKLNYLLGLNSIGGSKLEESDLPIAASAFAFEDEALYGLQYRLLRKYGKTEKRKRLDMDIYVEDRTLFYHGTLLHEARENFRQGLYDYLVTGEVLEWLTPCKEFSDSGGSTIRVYQLSCMQNDG